MENLELSIQNIKKRLDASNKEKLLCLSTTANLNNPDVFFGGIRETPTTIAGNIIVRTLDNVESLIEIFDGYVSYFLVDCEIKNEVPNLEAYALTRVHKSKVLVYKPNDFTVASLDMLLACTRGSLRGQKVAIIGLGNVGAKIALKLCERGANILVYERAQERMSTVITGLNITKRSDTQILGFASPMEAVQGADIVLGCTPGIPAIDKTMVASLNPGAMIVDVGNGTLKEDGIVEARNRGIEIHVLSSFGGYLGMIEDWLFQRKMLSGMRQKQFDGFTLIVPGILGAYGDILVDSIENMTRVIGLCDGKGDIMPIDEAKHFVQNIASTSANKETLEKIKQLYL